MRYFIIAGEASGDIHGSALIKSLKEQDSEAQVEFLGGDLMARSAGHEPLIHYRDMAFMGFIEVIKHLGSILGFMKKAKIAMTNNRPDALILIDYPSFNLKMAKWAKQQEIPVFYFISPKVWAWKEWRVKDINKYVDRMFSILPFETNFYRKHNYEVEYVGNPTVKEINSALATMRGSFLKAPHPKAPNIKTSTRSIEAAFKIHLALFKCRLYNSSSDSFTALFVPS